MLRYGYECYYHFYNYVPGRDPVTGKIISGNGTCTLGLATLVPVRKLRVVQSKLLRPWVNSEYTCEDLLVLDSLNARVESASEGEIPALQTEKEALQQKYRNTTPNYTDRTVLMLALESRRGPPRRFIVGNVHMPCQYRDPKVMVRIAVKTKKSILDWMETARLDCPLVLGGDFNSDPTEGSAAYRCFTGALDGVDVLIEDNRYISASEFSRSVTNEKWLDLMSEQPGGLVCTNFGFTKRNYEESLRKFKDFMESLAFSASVMAEPILQMQSFDAIVRSAENGTLLITEKAKLVEIVRCARKEKAQFFKPRVLVLDHFFLRDTNGMVERLKSRRSFVHEIVKRTKGLPIPDINGVKEPSDHLPIFLTLGWKK
jgi:endonuclease/exonuclease/phosphatase family metal-dependent hydrolase